MTTYLNLKRLKKFKCLEKPIYDVVLEDPNYIAVFPEQ
jgi:hypothetical protein